MSICSLVVQARPENLETVSESLSGMEGVEIHASSEAGKDMRRDKTACRFCGAGCSVLWGSNMAEMHPFMLYTR